MLPEKTTRWSKPISQFNSTDPKNHKITPREGNKKRSNYLIRGNNRANRAKIKIWEENLWTQKERKRDREERWVGERVKSRGRRKMDALFWVVSELWAPDLWFIYSSKRHGEHWTFKLDFWPNTWTTLLFLIFLSFFFCNLCVDFIFWKEKRKQRKKSWLNLSQSVR